MIGIDPGSVHLGWGILELGSGMKIRDVQFGVLHAKPRDSFYQRLFQLSSQLKGVLCANKPQVAVIERIFLGKNVDSAFKLGHIRGMCAVECQGRGLEIQEYAARTVKKQITGSGNSDKLTVQNFLSQQLGVRLNRETFDASDALALALCHVLNHSIQQRISRMEVR